MRPFVGLSLALAAALAIPGAVQARGYAGKSGVVMSPFGPVYNTSSPEWKQAGGNPLLYEQIVEQKQMMLQEQMMWKQQQQMMKLQQQKNQAGKGQTPAGNAGTAFNPLGPTAHRKKKRRTYDPTHPVTSAAVKAEAAKAEAARTTKPAPAP